MGKDEIPTAEIYQNKVVKVTMKESNFVYIQLAIDFNTFFNYFMN